MCIRDRFDTTIAIKTQVVKDFGYHSATSGFLFLDCEYIIILRHVSGGGGHFDYFMSKRTKEAIFPIGSQELNYILSVVTVI